MKIILFVLIFCPIFIFGQAWDYPVKPGTEKWKDIKSTEEKLKICQIPPEIITKLSTEDLVQLCMNYPLLGDILFSNAGYQNGFDIVSSNFNGFKELFKRQDAARALLMYYEKFDLNAFERNKGEIYTNVFFDICIDVVMSQPVFINALDKEQTIRLLKKSLDKLYIRKENANSLFRQKFTAVVLSRLLLKNSTIEKRSAIFESNDFLLLNNQYILVDTLLINKIQKEAENYLNLNK
ncbi:MAG: hypothetical protein M0Q54_06025 [Pigmentiphaga sp.]|nr:hypothetical protein [Pigmentiphaga sp.]